MIKNIHECSFDLSQLTPTNFNGKFHPKNNCVSTRTFYSLANQDQEFIYYWSSDGCDKLTITLEARWNSYKDKVSSTLLKTNSEHLTTPDKDLLTKNKERNNNSTAVKKLWLMVFTLQSSRQCIRKSSA